jgi:arylsulfatase A-like enzyme
MRLEDEDADAVNARLKEWRGELLETDPYFLYLHYFDPHDPFHARDPWFDLESVATSGWPEDDSQDDPYLAANLDWIMTRLVPGPEGLVDRKAEEFSQAEIQQLMAWIKAAYDSEIGFVDSRIREAFEMLGLEDSIVIFVADHGEEFYEHGKLTHGHNLYTHSMRVPFFIYLPEADAPKGRIETHVSTLDVVPTVRQLLQLPASEQDEGHDLLSGAPRGEVLGFLAGNSDQHALEEDLRSIASDRYRLIAGEDGLELYDLASDPMERQDLSGDLPEVADELLETMLAAEKSASRYRRAFRTPEGASEKMMEHLEGLGYLGNQ